MIATIKECKEQLEYLNKKFGQVESTNYLLAKLEIIIEIKILENDTKNIKKYTKEEFLKLISD